VHPHLPCRVRRAARLRREKADSGLAQLVARREHSGEAAIAPRDQRRHGAKVAREIQRQQRQIADALLTRAQEQADLGAAKLVDGLHGITHREQ
jgi:hypothetical protein